MNEIVVEWGCCETKVPQYVTKQKSKMKEEMCNNGRE